MPKKKFKIFILKSIIVKIDKNIKQITTPLCVNILLAGDEILLVSEKKPTTNIKKPNILNKIKLLKNKTEQIKIKIPPHNGGDLYEFLVSRLCLEETI